MNEKEYDRLIKHCENLEKQKKTQENDIAILKQEIELLKKKLEELTLEKESIWKDGQRIDAIIRERDDLKLKTSHQQKTIDQMKEIHNQHAIEQRQYKEKVKQQETMIKQYQQQVKEKDIEIKQLKCEVIKVQNEKEEIERSAKELDDDIKQMEHRERGYLERIEQLEQSLSTLSTSVASSTSSTLNTSDSTTSTQTTSTTQSTQSTSSLTTSTQTQTQQYQQEQQQTQIQQRVELEIPIVCIALRQSFTVTVNEKQFPFLLGIEHYEGYEFVAEGHGIMNGQQCDLVFIVKYEENPNWFIQQNELWYRLSFQPYDYGKTVTITSFHNQQQINVQLIPGLYQVENLGLIKPDGSIGLLKIHIVN